MTNFNGGGEPVVSRRTLSRGVAWSTPVVAAAVAAPAIAASTRQQCWTGDMSGALSSTWKGGYVQVTANGSTWRRFDWVVTVTNTWSSSTLTDLYYVVPWVWTGPLLNATAGPWTAATWNDASGTWTSNRSDSQGRRVYIAEYQTSTALSTQLYSTFLAMPYYPMATTSTGSTGTVVATHSASDHVYAIPMPSLAFGETGTFRFSSMIEYASGGVMEHAFWGDFMGTGCSTA